MEHITGSPVYGPVFSWRFGASLGVDLLLNSSICSFRCLYCQLGTINVPTSERRVWVSTERVVAAMLEVGWRNADVVTFSGNGEPTLGRNLGQTIRAVKRLAEKPVVVLTNGSLLGDATVREELLEADHVSCKLDAPADRLMMSLNRPVGNITLETVISGILKFREQFGGKLSIQTMLLPATAGLVRLFIPLLTRIEPDEIHVNLPSRFSPESWSPNLRGEHDSFSSDRAFRTLDHDRVMAFKNDIEAATGIRVKVPPERQSDDATEPVVTTSCAGERRARGAEER